MPVCAVRHMSRMRRVAHDVSAGGVKGKVSSVLAVRGTGGGPCGFRSLSPRVSRGGSCLAKDVRPQADFWNVGGALPDLPRLQYAVHSDVRCATLLHRRISLATPLCHLAARVAFK